MTAAFVMTQDFKDGFMRFQREAGGDLRTFMTEAMRVLVETCYHWTAPPTKGNRGSRGGREGGKAIIARDVYWMTAAVSQKYLDLLYERFGAAPITAQEFRKKDGSVYLIDNVTVNVDGSHDQIDAYHKSRRKQNGRVLTHANRVSSNIGRWTPRDKMLMTKEARDKYIKNTQKRVGKMKSGWMVALERVNSTLPPSWVGNAGNLAGHSGFAPAGTFEDKLDSENWSGYFAGSNKVGYFRDLDGFINRAHKYVETWMTSGRKWEGWVDRMIKKHSQLKAA